MGYAMTNEEFPIFYVDSAFTLKASVSPPERLYATRSVPGGRVTLDSLNLLGW